MRTTHVKRLAMALAIGVALAVAGVAAATPVHEGPEEGHPAPKGMSVTVKTRPAPGGVLVHVITRNFRWAPEHMSAIHGEGKVVSGEGHGHIYVDGAEKAATMVVGPWTYLRLDPGKHTLRITLNANDHNAYMRNGKPVQDTVTVTVPETSGS